MVKIPCDNGVNLTVTVFDRNDGIVKLIGVVLIGSESDCGNKSWTLIG